MMALLTETVNYGRLNQPTIMTKTQRFETVQQIKAAVDNGQTVYVNNGSYQVVKGRGEDNYLIKYLPNGSCIGLTWADGETLNESIEVFYVEKQVIDLPPTWQAAAKIYITVLQNGSLEGHKNAIAGLMQMADVAQAYVDKQKEPPVVTEYATLTLFTMYHMKANPGHIQISEIDDLIGMSAEFMKQYESADWEKNSWEDTVITFYNNSKLTDRRGWKQIN